MFFSSLNDFLGDVSNWEGLLTLVDSTRWKFSGLLLIQMLDSSFRFCTHSLYDFWNSPCVGLPYCMTNLDLGSDGDFMSCLIDSILLSDV